MYGPGASAKLAEVLKFSDLDKIAKIELDLIAKAFEIETFS